MKIKIITDSVSDIPPDLASLHQISVVPVYINFENKSYLDQIEISRSDYYSRLPNFKTVPSTSSPGPDAFIDAYEQAAGEGAEAIVSIHVAESISTTINAARLARDSFSKVPVWVVDSGQLSLGIGYQALTAARAAFAGWPVDRILEKLSDLRQRTYVYAVIENLEYLQRSGRISRYRAKLGSLVKLKPILSFHDSKISLEMAVTTTKALSRIHELVTRFAPLQHLSFVHVAAKEKVENLQRQLKNLFPLKETPIVWEVTPAIGTHIGPGAVGVVLVKA